MKNDACFKAIIRTSFGLAALDMFTCYLVTKAVFWLILSVCLLASVFFHTLDPLKKTGIVEVIIIKCITIVSVFIISYKLKEMNVFFALCAIEVIICSIICLLIYKKNK